MKKALLIILALGLTCSLSFADDWKDLLPMDGDEYNTTNDLPAGVSIDGRASSIDYITEQLNEPYSSKRLAGGKIIGGSLLVLLGAWGYDSETSYGVCSGSIFGVVGLNLIIGNEVFSHILELSARKLDISAKIMLASIKPFTEEIISLGKLYGITLIQSETAVGLVEKILESL